MREKSAQELDSYYQIVMEELDRANSIINDFYPWHRAGFLIKRRCCCTIL